jgi:hypothetical protein
MKPNDTLQDASNQNRRNFPKAGGMASSRPIGGGDRFTRVRRGDVKGEESSCRGEGVAGTITWPTSRGTN